MVNVTQNEHDNRTSNHQYPRSDYMINITETH